MRNLMNVNKISLGEQGGTGDGVEGSARDPGHLDGEAGLRWIDKVVERRAGAAKASALVALTAVFRAPTLVTRAVFGCESIWIAGELSFK